MGIPDEINSLSSIHWTNLLKSLRSLRGYDDDAADFDVKKILEVMTEDRMLLQRQDINDIQIYFENELQ